MAVQVKRVVIIGTSVVFFGTTLSLKTKIGGCSAVLRPCDHPCPVPCQLECPQFFCQLVAIARQKVITV